MTSRHRRLRSTGCCWLLTNHAGLLHRAAEHQVSVGFVAIKTSSVARLYALPRSLDKQIALAFSTQSIPVDITYCNEELVTGVAAIGDVPFLDARGRTFVRTQSSLLRRWLATLGIYWLAIRRLFSIRPTQVRLQIGDEERTRRSAVTGVVIVESDADRLGGQLVGERLSARNGRLSALLIAPASVAAYIAALMRATVGGGRLPRALSLVQTSRLIIEADQPLAYRIDGRRRSATRIVFEVAADALKVNVGRRFIEDNPEERRDRDTLRLQTLPENEARLASISARLPLFTHALEDDFKDLFQLLRDNAKTTPDYVILMVASTLLAAFGLVLNSAAVIIGAMVLAPLMAPIVSLAMGILRRESRLIQQSGRSIATGVALALGVAALVSLLMPLQRVTAEIDSRLHPSLLDLGVAVVSGIAAAYAHAREHIIKSLPGVAIAVALVPPLAVAGIGLGWGEWRVFGGAFLLFLTNLVGIASTAALTFLVLGYAPIQTAARGLRILAVAMVLMALPLTLSFSQIVSTARLERRVTSEPVSLRGQPLPLSDVQVRREDGRVVVRASVAAPFPVGIEDLDGLKSQLSDRAGEDVRLELDVRLVR